MIHCTCSPDEQIYEGTGIAAPHMQQGEQVWSCPLEVQDVGFCPGKMPERKSVAGIDKAVDGQRREMTNLKQKFHPTA